MAIKKVTFEFPAEAWEGIVLSLTHNQWPATIPNPDYNGTDPTIPMYIPNDGDRAQAAIQQIKNYVEQQFKSWAMQERMTTVSQQAQAEVSAIATAVTSATQTSVIDE